MTKKKTDKSARKSKRRRVVFLIALLLGALFIVATIFGMRSPANVELIDLRVTEVKWDAEHSFHSDVTLLIQNTGKRTARDVRVYLYIQDGGGEVEYTGYQYFPDLTTLRTESRTLTVELDAEDKRMTGTIIVYWDNNSNIYKF